ncbi:hypothetical protein V6N12_053911 [Hibiscus sabdariffa]|uniref:Peptidase C1A papain C-terminal domain-containing protein n=1 Tax=Hibiscus sabdariffa TaxID=183260 RepID=A0ABR2D8Y4_9ROSI
MGLSPLLRIKEFLAAVASIESAHKIATGELLDLSVQQVLDCNKLNRFGFAGGHPIETFWHVMQNGIVETKYYPYNGLVGECRPMNGIRHIFIDDFCCLEYWDDAELMTAVSRQPVVVGINASVAFQLYRGGILRGECSARANHAILVVGYKSFLEKPVWIIKNSWGKNWGIKGYAYMERFVEYPYGIVGPHSFPVYPIIKPIETTLVNGLNSKTF